MRTREIEVTSYAELVLGAAGLGRRAPGLLQDVRAHRVPRASGALLATAGAARPTSRSSGRRITRSSRAARRRPASSKPTGAIHRPRPRDARAAGDARGPRAVGQCRHGTRCGVRAALPPAGARRRTARIAFWTCVASSRAAAARPRRQASRPRMRTRASRRWPGPRHRCSCGISAWTRHRPASSSSSRATSCSPTPRRAPRAMPSSAAHRPPHCGRKASPAICPSC